jgi:transcriptional regulator with XRE-family HTH domain
LNKKLSDKTIEKAHKQIGENVKKLRKEKGLSQLDLSFYLGYKSVSTLSMAEIHYRGAHFNIEQLLNIASILEVSVKDLFDGVDEKKILLEIIES